MSSPEPDPSTPDPNQQPTVLGYEIVSELGRGGLGAVYRARDAELGREVAIKVLSDRFGADSPAAQRFAEAGRITAQLPHPGIPPVYAFGRLSDGRPFIAMKLIKGQTLDDILQWESRASDRGRFLAVFVQVCQTVAYAH